MHYAIYQSHCIAGTFIIMCDISTIFEFLNTSKKGVGVNLWQIDLFNYLGNG